jgi:hypothetical protein
MFTVPCTTPFACTPLLNASIENSAAILQLLISTSDFIVRTQREAQRGTFVTFLGRWRSKLLFPRIAVNHFAATVQRFRDSLNSSATRHPPQFRMYAACKYISSDQVWMAARRGAARLEKLWKPLSPVRRDSYGP